jgi:uncharacterized protein YeaO (DUF488 family)
MAIRVVRLGSPRLPGEGLRIGSVRRPRRGVAKERHAKDNWYDVWFPELAPSEEAFRLARTATTPQDWKAFVKRYRAEMSTPDKLRILALLAALSRQSNFSVGCYCEDETRCHRSILRTLLQEQGATIT